MTEPAETYGSDVVYTVTMRGGAEITGRFLTMQIARPFWTMETIDAEPWIDLNPAHVLTIEPAQGRAYSDFVAQYGEAR